MKWTIKKVTLCIVVACVFFAPLFCMDKPDICTLPGSCEIILSLLESRHKDLDHFVCCILGSTCKKWNKLLLDTAPERKKDLMVRVQNETKCYSNLHVRFDIWHKYGSAWGTRMCCGADSHHNEKDYIHSLSLRMLYFGHEKIRFTGWGFAQAITGFERPKFNEAGSIICYGSHVDKHVREYRLNNNISCWLLLEKYRSCTNFIKLLPFKSFPHLLKAFLDGLETDEGKRFKFCNLNKVIIPDNYKECVLNDECPSYDNLPEYYRRKIDQRYREQKK